MSNGIKAGVTTHYCCCVDLGAILKCRPVALGAVRAFDPSARVSDDSEILARAIIMQAQGRDAWPLCDRPDKKGHCEGHET